jgi:LacI family transcriptional regulator
MKRSRTVTIDEVARYAGVSSATISRALNNPSAVKPSTQAKISAAIAKLGYMPNASARALMLGRSETVGAVVPTLDNAIFAKGLEQLQASMAQAGFQLIVASCNYDRGGHCTVWGIADIQRDSPASQSQRALHSPRHPEPARQRVCLWL